MDIEFSHVASFNCRLKRLTESPIEDTSKSHRTTKSDAHSKRLVEVEQMAEDLEDKHGGRFTHEQYNVWVH